MLKNSTFLIDEENESLFLIPDNYAQILHDLQDLSIMFDYHYEQDSDSVESHFYSPEGLKIILTEDPSKSSKKQKIAHIELPSPSVQDSVNFWHTLGFEVVASPARAFAWVELSHSTLKLSVKDKQHCQKLSFNFS